MTSPPIAIVTFTTLFPSAARPHHGIFVANRLNHLAASGKVSASVIAPVPWFPSGADCFGRYAAFHRTPLVEHRERLEVAHPRYLLPPRVGMVPAPVLLYLGARATFARILASGKRIDLIDAHYFYPDGVAAALLAREFRVPFVITARGTDISLLPRYRIPRRAILWAGRRSSAMIAVCAALKTEMARIGLDESKITVLRNGIDLETFRPLDRAASRAALSEPSSGVILASVGHLTERKGHDLVIATLPGLPGARLLVAGDGEERSRLTALAIRLGVAERVRFLGAVPHRDLCRVYSAADALVLASSREGWANVLLEAMACGTPVVATAVWGTPEVVAAPAAGRLVEERSAAAIASEIKALLASPPPRHATRAYAEQYGWGETTQGQLALFRRILRRREQGAAEPAVASSEW